jgi:hypothetical protein
MGWPKSSSASTQPALQTSTKIQICYVIDGKSEKVQKSFERLKKSNKSNKKLSKKRLKSF